jgi:hypothetical protein
MKTILATTLTVLALSVTAASCGNEATPQPNDISRVDTSTPSAPATTSPDCRMGTADASAAYCRGGVDRRNLNRLDFGDDGLG